MATDGHCIGGRDGDRRPKCVTPVQPTAGASTSKAGSEVHMSKPVGRGARGLGKAVGQPSPGSWTMSGWVHSTVWCFFFLSSRWPILLLKINSVARASHSYVCARLPLLLTHTPLPTNPNHQSLTPPLVAAPAPAPALLLPPQPKPPTPPAAAPPRAAGPKRGARAAWGAIGTPGGTAPLRSTGAAPSLFLFVCEMRRWVVSAHPSIYVIKPHTTPKPTRTHPRTYRPAAAPAPKSPSGGPSRPAP